MEELIYSMCARVSASDWTERLWHCCLCCRGASSILQLCLQELLHTKPSAQTPNSHFICSCGSHKSIDSTDDTAVYVQKNTKTEVLMSVTLTCASVCVRSCGHLTVGYFLLEIGNIFNPFPGNRIISEPLFQIRSFIKCSCFIFCWSVL